MMNAQITKQMPKQRISTKKPHWLRRKLPSGPEYESVRSLLKKGALHTVCQEARCPNQFECFSHRTATFLIMGPDCTRNCRFCSVGNGPDRPPDADEPVRVAEAAAQLNLRYAVVTSVTRDDLADGGASYFAETIKEIRGRIPDVKIEVLIPDLQGDKTALETILDAGPDVLNHNIETVPRLYETVRPQAIYGRSLELMRRAAHYARDIPVKSGLMLGLGETEDEIRQTLADLYNANCRILTIGQYLQPTASHLPVGRFVLPEEFEAWRDIALKIGFSETVSGPFVRSSYHAGELFEDLKQAVNT